MISCVIVDVSICVGRGVSTTASLETVAGMSGSLSAHACGN